MMFRPLKSPRRTTEDRRRSLEARGMGRRQPKLTLVRGEGSGAISEAQGARVAPLRLV